MIVWWQPPVDWAARMQVARGAGPSRPRAAAAAAAAAGRLLTVAGNGVALLDLLSVLSDQHGLLREGKGR